MTAMIKYTYLLVVLLLVAAPVVPQATGEYAVDPSKSKLEIQVGREGLFKFLGHDHLIVAKNFSGEVHFNQEVLERSSVQIKVDASSLVVADPAVDEKERREVQATMEGPRVLDVKQFPTIRFSSTALAATKRTATGYELTLTGKLDLHGVERTISFPARLWLEANQLRAQGTVEVLQTDYKITPIRVGGGTVKVKDKLKITFDVVASR
jgi:polyisoprenoid-binding protein YceI